MIPITAFRGQRVAVVGLARSGLAAARALAAGGAAVAAWDDAEARRTAQPFPVVDPAAADWDRLAAVVLSPGIPLTHPAPHAVVRQASAHRVPVIGDVELLFRAGLGARTVGITGTNGKSTTTALVGHLLRAAGREVQVGGNIGAPVLDLDPLGPAGIYVIELSSFQIDLTPSLACDIAVLLNITPDHLDRHGDMAGYVAVKRRIFQGEGAAVIGVDDEWGRRICAELAGGARRLRPVSVETALDAGISILDGAVRIDGRPEPAIDLGRARALIGRHNHQNAAAAIAVGLELGLSVAEIARGLASFPGLAHRLERIAELGGIAYVNDSKATNADAAGKALAAFRDIYWIAGGKAKAGGIEALRPFFPRIRHAFLIGEAAAAFAATLDGAVGCTRSGTLDQAVHDAHAMAAREGRPGAVVLLSPACASYDQFSDFEARGDAFRRAVAALAPATAGGAA